ncbi:MAG: penicillin-binding transpeptidase domain-containing protein [Bilophila wadsworthia]
MKKHIIGTLFALVLLASVARASETVERTDLADIFQGFDGTFIMYDEGADRYTVFNKALSETRLPPCSTFKVFHALIGLDSGVLDRDDARTLMKWNGKPSSIAAWNHDQTLASAMRHSVVWYFQRVATGIGEERMQRGLDRIGYGNRDISGGLTRFWLQSSLKISPREQVGLLRALFNGSLPFAAEDIAVVKRDITLSSGKGLRFMGKTGSGSDDADRGIIGWFVGGVETPHNRWSFAVNIQGPDASGRAGRGIAKRRSNGSASCPSVPAPPKGGCAAAPQKLQLFPAVHSLTIPMSHAGMVSALASANRFSAVRPASLSRPSL